MKVLIAAFLAVVFFAGCAMQTQQDEGQTEIRMVEVHPLQPVEGSNLRVRLNPGGQVISLPPAEKGDYKGYARISPNGKVLTIGAVKFFLNDGGVIVRKRGRL